MYCKNCGIMISKETKICPQCGAKFSNTQRVALNKNIAMKNNVGKGFGIASIIASIFSFASIQMGTEKVQILIFTALALLLGIISFIESCITNQKRVLAYISIIYSALFLFLSPEIIVECNECGKEGSWGSMRCNECAGELEDWKDETFIVD